MAIYQRGRIWYADYYANGERIQESTGTANRREAEKFLAMRLSEVRRNVFAKPSNITLPELGLRYIAHARLHKRSWKRDVQMLKNLESFFGRPKLRDITPLRVEDYQRERVRAVSPATSNREMALLKHMFNMAERWGEHYGSNPVRLVRFLPEDNLRFETLSEEQEKRLLLASPPYLREMIVFAIHTGLRTSDIFGLQWTEVDIEQRRVKKIVMKSARLLSLPMNDAAFGVIESRLAVRHGPYVFYNPMTGDRFSDVKNALTAAVKRAGLPRVTWHMFRHTFASRLTRNGVDLVTVKDLLGHANISTTMRYAHSNDAAKREAVNRLGSSDNIVAIVPRTANVAV
ncbi:MAG TPA: site-specific integrase [Terriglobia bacterium]|nr:site-specific integrase [Terriglobia bacterium]